MTFHQPVPIGSLLQLDSKVHARAAWCQTSAVTLATRAASIRPLHNSSTLLRLQMKVFLISCCNSCLLVSRDSLLAYRLCLATGDLHRGRLRARQGEQSSLPLRFKNSADEAVFLTLNWDRSALRAPCYLPVLATANNQRVPGRSVACRSRPACSRSTASNRAKR